MKIDFEDCTGCEVNVERVDPDSRAALIELCGGVTVVADIVRWANCGEFNPKETTIICHASQKEGKAIFAVSNGKPTNSKNVRDIPFTIDFSDDPVLVIPDEDGCFWLGRYCFQLDIDPNTLIPGLPVLLDSMGVSKPMGCKWIPFTYGSSEDLTVEECKAVLPRMKSLEEITKHGIHYVLGCDEQYKDYLFTKAKNGTVLCCEVNETRNVRYLVS